MIGKFLNNKLTASSCIFEIHPLGDEDPIGCIDFLPYLRNCSEEELNRIISLRNQCLKLAPNDPVSEYVFKESWAADHEQSMWMAKESLCLRIQDLTLLAALKSHFPLAFTRLGLYQLGVLHETTDPISKWLKLGVDAEVRAFGTIGLTYFRLGEQQPTAQQTKIK